MLLKVLLSLGYFLTGFIVSSTPQSGLPITAPKSKAVLEFQLGKQSSGLCTVKVADRIQNQIDVLEGETILLRFHAPYFMNTVSCNHVFRTTADQIKPMNPFKSGSQVFVRSPQLNEYVNSMEMVAEQNTNGCWVCDVLTNQIDWEISQLYSVNSNTYVKTICNFSVRFIVPEIATSTILELSSTSTTSTTEPPHRYTDAKETIHSSTSEKSYTPNYHTLINRNNITTSTEHTEKIIDQKNITSTTERTEKPTLRKNSKKWIYIAIAGLVAVILALKIGLFFYCRTKARKTRVRIIRRTSYDNYDDDKKISFLNQTNAGQKKMGERSLNKKNTAKEGEHLYESLEDIPLGSPKSKASEKGDDNKRLPKFGATIHTRRVPTPDISNVQRIKAGRERLVRNDISKRPPFPTPVSEDSKVSIDSRASPFTRANRLITKVQEKSSQKSTEKSGSPKPPKPARNLQTAVMTRPPPVTRPRRVPSEIPSESEFEVYSEESEYNRDELIYTSEDEWDYEPLSKYNMYNS